MVLKTSDELFYRNLKNNGVEVEFTGKKTKDKPKAKPKTKEVKKE